MVIRYLKQKNTKDWVKAAEEGRPAWTYCDTTLSHGTDYGKLYNWFTVNDPRGLAPKGWHIATSVEWESAIQRHEQESFAGKAMKSVKDWLDDGNGMNTFGFNALPGGSRTVAGDLEGKGTFGFWWAPEENDTNTAWLYMLESGSPSVSRTA